MQQDFTRFAGDSHVWVDELPHWANLDAIGTVDTYWRWHGIPPTSAAERVAAWGYRVGFGGSGEYGVLGGRFDPHEYPFLRVRVSATVDVARRAEKPFDAARVGLPHEFVGGALAGALQEAERLGPGTLHFTCSAVHPVDSSWEAFRVLAVGVARLIGLPTGATAVPSELLPYFGGDTPASPGVG